MSIDDRDTDSSGPKETVKLGKDAVLDALAGFERDIPKLVQTAIADADKEDDDPVPLEAFATIYFRLWVLEARVALLEGRPKRALELLSRKTVLDL